MESSPGEGHSMFREGTTICTTDVCQRLPCNKLYENLLDIFSVPSLRNRRLFLSLCTFYCIVVHFPQQNIVHPIMSSTRNFNPHAFLVPFSRCNALKFSFFCTVIRLWNFLPHTSEHYCGICLHFFCLLKYVFMLYGSLHKLASAILCIYQALLCRIKI